MRLYEQIARTISAYQHCLKNGNQFAQKHLELLDYIESDMLPSGSGIDRGTKIDLDASHENKIVLLVDYHHMNDNGMYDGWTHHKMYITPAFIGGFDIRVTGRNRNEIKEYLADTYNHVLSQEWSEATNE